MRGGLCAAPRLNVFIQNLIDRGPSESLGQNLIRFRLDHIAVLYRQIRDDSGVPGATMASPAGHHPLSAERAPVECSYHHDHHAALFLEGSFVRLFSPVSPTLFA